MKKFAFAFIILILIIVSTILTNQQPSLVEQVDVYTAGEGYWFYRIPAIETAPDGTLLAFAEARKYGRQDPGFGQQDVDLVLKRSTDSGKSWSKMEVIDDPGEAWSAANPTTLVDKETNKVWVLYYQSKPGKSTLTSRPKTDDLKTIARFSEDNGLTWSSQIDLTNISRDMEDGNWNSSIIGPGGAIQTSDGRLLFPAWKTPYNIFTIYSDDHGETWHRGEFVPRGHQGNENQLVELNDGRILMDIRQVSGNIRLQAISDDRGETWSEAFQSRKAIACSSIERLTLKAENDDRDRIIWSGPKGPERNNLVAKISYDEGETFPKELMVALEPAAYSDLTILSDKTIGILWERDEYNYISFTRLDLKYLESRSTINYLNNLKAI